MKPVLLAQLYVLTVAQTRHGKKGRSGLLKTASVTHTCLLHVDAEYKCCIIAGHALTR